MATDTMIPDTGTTPTGQAPERTTPLRQSAKTVAALSFDLDEIGRLTFDVPTYTAILHNGALGAQATVTLPLIDGAPAQILTVNRARAGFPEEQQWDLEYVNASTALYRRPVPPLRMAGTPKQPAKH